ncbi:MAG: LysR substrate-binding domain-containing protein [Ascidiaceihabitans sp.]|uniref:LysR substrate-binding domain-containing protein n=1 Tax=Rhodobacterales TaxID=204455 RepID=UPI00329801A5
MKRLPSTQALRALESFLRHGAVWKAADELNLTRSAVSHQLRLLERDLGFALFNRVGTRIELTTRGSTYANDVSAALSLISLSAARNAGQELSGQLCISCTPGFAATWLSTKIGKFRRNFPEIALSIITPKLLEDVTNPDVDVFIAFGESTMKDVEVELLKEVEFTPLISPVLLNRLGAFQEPGDVLRGDLLHLADQEDWKAWFQAAGCSPDLTNSGVFFADMNLVYGAAMNAQGLAMGDEFICREAMETGHLVRLFDLSIKSPKAYYLAIPSAKSDFASVVAFRDWILDELSRSNT